MSLRLRLRVPTSPAYLPLSELLAGVDGGYYWREIATGREECSGRLRQMLELKDYDNDMAALLKALGEAHAAIITQAISGVEQGKGSTRLTMNLRGGIQQLECTVSGAQDAQSKITHVILWFTDTSASNKQLGRLVKENGQLKRDVKQFSNILNILPRYGCARPMAPFVTVTSPIAKLRRKVLSTARAMKRWNCTRRRVRWPVSPLKRTWYSPSVGMSLSEGRVSSIILPSFPSLRKILP